MENKKKLSDETKALFIRMWFAGIICLFVAWTPLGGGENESNSFIFQMIFMLAFGLFISNLLVTNPIIKGLYRTHLDNISNYFNQSLFKRVLKHFLHFIKMIVIVILIWLSYILINKFLILIGFEEVNEKPLLMLEPISFGLLYGLYYFLLNKLVMLFIKNKRSMK